eukprot:CAMPEP_0203771670 /NCGR_PEP_ID=MMETSP0099_2-20121227/3547_1 /ASSEMBLY_ACC=CAM_ASM_000209 /TAXON_ID=96639 /ORGANISM=" , Strain NY0313808BC1" /LENGTH=76 /DNA_ID=CAMNT_0050669047 /DNA_START=156 /DNA_END=386 /DNA_ORIENTATION=-
MSKGTYHTIDQTHVIAAQPHPIGAIAVKGQSAYTTSKVATIWAKQNAPINQKDGMSMKKNSLARVEKITICPVIET